MVACTRRIAPASHGTKATSLGTARVEHAAWCRPSPHARDLGVDHLAVRRDLPAGTVTFVFTDVVGSTRLLGELGAEAYAEALAEHRRVVRGACARHGGVEVDTQGDAFFLAFASAP